MKCKGSEPALLPVTLDAEARERNKQARNKPPGGKAKQEIEDMKEKLNKDKQSDPSVNPAAVEGMDEPQEDPDAAPDLSQGPIAPKYSMVYSYDMSLGNFVNTSNIYEPKSKETPTQIRFRFELPLISSAENLKCDVQPTRLQLEYEGIYYLALDLLYEVNDGAAKAKFVSSKKVLELILPIVRKIRGHELSISQDAPVIKPLEATTEQTAEEQVPDESATEPQLKPDEGPESVSQDIQSDPQTSVNTLATHEENSAVITEANSALSKPEENSIQTSVANSIEESAKHPEKLDGQGWLNPQTTYLEKLWIFLFHLPGYKPHEIEIVDSSEDLILRLKSDRFWHLHFESKQTFHFEKTTHKDYFGLHVHFGSPEEAGLAKLDHTVNPETPVQAEGLFRLLLQQKLAKEAFTRPVVEELGRQDEQPVRDSSSEQISAGANASVTETGGPEESAGPEAEESASGPERDLSKGQDASEGPRTVEAVQLDLNNLGPQLLELSLMAVVCQLD